MANLAQYFFDLVYSFGNCLSCFPGSPTLKINSRSFKILRLLGEGGFSYVYLVEDTSTHEQFALKKIRCPFGAESVAQAMREVEAYRLFANTPGIIHAVDHAVATERGGGGGIGTGADDGSSKTVYILLPYYRRGNLQDMINANLVSGSRFPERQLMMLFLDVCKAVREMHHYKGPGREVQRMEMGDEVEESGRKGKKGKGKAGGKGGRAATVAAADEEDEGEQQRPLMDGEDRIGGGGKGGRSYVHRDIKPGNIMITDSGLSPVLMDLGSLQPSPQAITDRSQALAAQDTAAEHSTMPYRAPELFDVSPGMVLDGKVDVWSLGCTLFACLVGKSPFEMRSDETGGSLSICVLGGDWRFPDEVAGAGGGKGKGAAGGAPKRTGTGLGASGGVGDGQGQGQAAGGAASGAVVISEPIKHVIRQCLKVETAERPDINELIVLVERALEQLPDDDQ